MKIEIKYPFVTLLKSNFDPFSVISSVIWYLFAIFLPINLNQTLVPLSTYFNREWQVLTSDKGRVTPKSQEDLLIGSILKNAFSGSQSRDN